MRYAIVTNGIVTNIIEADADYAASIGAVAPGVAGIGWAYAGGVFTAPAAVPPVVPQVVTIRQACRQLEIDGLLDDVEAIVAGLSKLDQIDWQRATVVERTHPLVEAVRLQKSMTPAQIDALFIAAEKL